MNDLISRSAFDEVLDELEGLKAHAAFTEGIMVVRRELEQFPAVDAVSPGLYEQIKWERDVAIKQLEELGIGFGQKKPDMEPVRHGYWIPQDNTYTKFMCSDCKGRNHDGSGKYCSECGCKMDAEVSE